MNKVLNDEMYQKISNCLNNKANEVSANEEMFFNIKSGIYKENKGVLYNMKIKFLRFRTAIVSGILCIATTVTVAAATNGSFWISSSSINNEIKTFPTSDTVKSTVGFLPKYVDSFKGGFKFESFNYANTSLKNSDDGKEIIKTREAHFYYNRDGAVKNQILDMSAVNINREFFDKKIDPKAAVTEYRNIKLYYSSIQSKFVPENYKKTEEDIKLIGEGLLQIGYGSDKIDERKTQTVSWYEDGIGYLIMNMSYDDVDSDAMIDMAKSVIDK